jgi:hypothetical protein
MKQQSVNQLFIKTPGDLTTRDQAHQFLALGDRMGWQTQVIGQAPMLKEAIRLQDWMLVPAHEDITPLPARTMRRIRTIYSQGLRPQGFVVAHEAPMQLTAPKPVIVEKSPMEWEGVGKAVGAITKVLGILLMGSVLLPLGLIAGMVLLDPILVAVTEDGYWIEIDRWQV